MRDRSSHRRCSVRKGVLRNFTKFTGKHLCQRLFFNKVAGLRPATLLKKSLWHRCFPVNFAKFLRTPFLQNTSGRLLLEGLLTNLKLSCTNLNEDPITSCLTIKVQRKRNCKYIMVCVSNMVYYGLLLSNNDCF